MAETAAPVSRPGRATSRSHSAYEALKTAIVSAELAAGTAVNETEWAERLGMSRTPVREALNRLRQEGLVEIVPHRGTFVREASLDDLREIFELRKVLEALAAEEAVTRLSDEDILAAEASWEELERMLDSGVRPDMEAVSRLDNAFHMMIVNHSTNARLRDFMHGLNQEVLRYQLLTARLFADLHGTIQQHLALARLLEERDPEAMARALKEHITSSERVIFSAR